MRKTAALFAIIVFHACVALGQSATLHVTITNAKGTVCYGYMPGQPKFSSVDLTLNDGGTATHIFQLSRPQFVALICFDPKNYAQKNLNYLMYLSPGDDVHVYADMRTAGFAFRVAGKGSNNNRPLLSAMENPNLFVFNNDTVPNRVISAVNAAQHDRDYKLAQYIKMYKPSAAYAKDWKMNLRYFACDEFYSFSENNKIMIGDAYTRNFAKWQKITDSLFSVAPLNNDAALAAFHYDDLAYWFLLRRREDFSGEASAHPVAFYREWYNTDTAEGKKLFNADTKNIPQEKIINRYFSGNAAEYMYALLFAGAASRQSLQNIPAIFARFRRLYPNSPYIAQFKPWVDTIIEKQRSYLNSNMVFLDANGSVFNSLDDILAVLKGKTVLVDMWGTWCAPCRQEIEKNSGAIREHFKGKGLTYLYIANNDAGHEEQWKKLIAYYNMEGTHLLANDKLTNDIMARVKGTGFPTMFIIKKDGTVELSKTDYPIQRDILYKQLEGDLKE